jgi:hypothetical protein
MIHRYEQRKYPAIGQQPLQIASAMHCLLDDRDKLSHHSQAQQGDRQRRSVKLNDGSGDRRRTINSIFSQLRNSSTKLSCRNTAVISLTIEVPLCRCFECIFVRSPGVAHESSV